MQIKSARRRKKKSRQIKRRQVGWGWVGMGWGWVKFYYNISIDWGLRANLLAKFYLEWMLVISFFKCKIKALSRLGDLRGGYLASWPAPLVRSELETTLTRTDIRNHLNTTENNCILKRKIYWIAKATTVFLYLYFCIWMSISGLLEYGLVDYNLVDFHEWHSNRAIISEPLFSKKKYL